MVSFLSADYFGPQNFSNVIEIIKTGYHLGYRILLGSIASVGMICGAFLLNNYIHNHAVPRFLASLGRYTLAIYIIQTVVLEGFLASKLNFDNTSWALFYFLIAPVISIAVILFSVTIAKLIDESSIASYFYLGHEHKLISKYFL